MTLEYKIDISPIALTKIKEILDTEPPNSYLRLGVKGGGCSGYEYVIKFENSEPNSKDLIFNIDAVKVIVDNKSILLINGTKLDWEKTLISQGFIFINPNEKSRCSCGHSFTT